MPRIALLSVLAACHAAVDTGDTDVTPIVEPRLAFAAVNTPIDLTPDGAIALLQEMGSPDQEASYLDTTTDALTAMTTTGDFEHPATAIAADGARFTAFHSVPIQAGVWSAADGWLDLGNPNPTGCDPNASSAWDISADGSIVVGLAWNGCHTEAMWWTDASGTGQFVPMDVLGGGSERATVVSDDGTVAAGFAAVGAADRSPAIWLADGSGTLLEPTGEAIGEVLSITPDGRTVAGIWNQEAFYRNADEGVVHIGKLPDAMPTDASYPNAIAADGELIFGGSGDPWGSGINAFVWTRAGGMVRLADVATANGLVIPEGTVLTNAIAASTDGTVVLGSALDATFTQTSFVLHLPLSAYGL